MCRMKPHRIQKKRLQPYLDYLEEEECEFNLREAVAKKHIRLPITRRGKKFTVTLPVSPSDRKTFLNWKSDVRRVIQELE